MVALLAIAVFVAFILVLAMPGLMLVARPGSGRIAAPFYIAVLAAFYLHYVGLGFGTAPPAIASTQAGSSGACEQAVSQSEQLGLILDRSDPAHVRVDAALWGQFPDQAKDAIVACLQGMQPDGQSSSVEIVEVTRH